jgi:hypothetical protein
LIDDRERAPHRVDEVFARGESVDANDALLNILAISRCTVLQSANDLSPANLDALAAPRRANAAIDTALRDKLAAQCRHRL